MTDQSNIKNFTKEVDAILWKEWNPIDPDVPEDEYTSYALTVAGKVWNHENDKAILDYLYWTENENMGLKCKREEADLRNIPIVKKISQLVKKYKS